MGGMKSRNKGKRGEREVVHVLDELGLTVRRTQQYSGGEGTSDGVIGGWPELHVEVKRHKARLMVYRALFQAREDMQGGTECTLPMVITRTDWNPWIAAMELETLAFILQDSRGCP